MALVYVHAWEYVNGPTEAGGGGFNWYWEAASADSAFNAAPDADGEAHFRFDFDADTLGDVADVEGKITAAIDAELIGLCATCPRRRVGRDVLAYWQASGFKMGDATNPAT